MPKPTIGRIVLYKSIIDNGPGNDVVSPAIIIRTRDTTVAAVVERWAALPPGQTMTVGEGEVVHTTAQRPADFVAELPDDTTIDLYVFGLGKSYREYAVPQGDERGQWQWPSMSPPARF